METKELGSTLLGRAAALATAIRQQGLSRFAMSLLAGMLFLRLVDRAVAARIQAVPVRGATIKKDTGLTDLGAAQLFPGHQVPAFVGMGLLAAGLIPLGVVCLWSLPRALLVPGVPFAGVVGFAFMGCALVWAGLHAALWALLVLWQAACKSGAALLPEDRQLVAEIQRRNPDLSMPEGLACRSYGDLAQCIVDMRHQLAQLEAQRAI